MWCCYCWFCCSDSLIPLHISTCIHAATRHLHSICFSVYASAQTDKRLNKRRGKKEHERRSGRRARSKKERKMQRSHDTNSNKKSHNIIIYIFVLCTVPIKKIVICVRNKTKFKTQRETSQPASHLAYKPCEYECACGLPEVYADRIQSSRTNATATVLALIAICRFVAQPQPQP